MHKTRAGNGVPNARRAIHAPNANTTHIIHAGTQNTHWLQTH